MTAIDHRLLKHLAQIYAHPDAYDTSDLHTILLIAALNCRVRMGCEFAPSPVMIVEAEGLIDGHFSALHACVDARRPEFVAHHNHMVTICRAIVDAEESVLAWWVVQVAEHVVECDAGPRGRPVVSTPKDPGLLDPMTDTTIADALDLVVNAMCAHTGSSSPSKHHLDGGTLDWIARCLRDGMSLPEAVADAWPRRDAAVR